jgi:ubiquinone/menaquinone biosynthesis C-methylase UbiE
MGEIAAEVPKDRFIQCDVDEQEIPIPAKSCDFVVASHIAEHVEDPEHFCWDLERIGKAGYIETPGLVQELLHNFSMHPWWVTKVGKTLIFIKKPGFVVDHEWSVPCRFPFNVLYYLFRNTCYHWKEAINVVVIE